jgi:hypothetical protein
MEIDLVYLWVDGNDPEWLRRKLATVGDSAEGSETHSKARWANNDELRYSLRSAERYDPCIRRGFIVTDGQTPEWLDTSNPRVQVVDHAEILPPEAMPCFNSRVIEYFMYRIPGLAEHFLYANDDMFFGSAVEEGFFFGEDGYPIVRLKSKPMGKLRFVIKKVLKIGFGNYRRAIFRAAREVERVTGKYYSAIPHHNIDAYRLSDSRRVAEEIFPELITPMITHHIRTEGDLQRVAISFWELAVGRARQKFVDNYESLRIGVHKPDYMGTFRRYSPALFCLNDSQRATDEDRTRIRPFLEELFPEPSAFEKVD